MVGHWIDPADLWKSKARTLQLQLRERLRVAVHRHRQRQMFSGNGYFSSTLQRYLQRFHNFRRDSLASSSSFYRRRVSKDIYAEEDSVITRMLQTLAVPILGNLCHVFMHGLNRVEVYGAEKLHQALLHRPKDKPLVTMHLSALRKHLPGALSKQHAFMVSNHVASMDDPLVIASLLPPCLLMEAHNLRWTLCATDRCFKNPVTSAFFRCVKVLPVSRGDGVYQKGLDMAISKLNSGGWVHIFPEGSRSRNGGRTIGSAKRGVGRLVLDAENTPMVVPFVHTGMQEIMPIGAKFPRINKTVTVLIGDPIQFDDILNSEGTDAALRGNLYDAISSRIGDRLRELKIQVDELALQQPDRLRNSSLSSDDEATVVLQQVDWELFGMSDYIVSHENSSLELEKTDEQLRLTHRKLPNSDRYNRRGFTYETGTMSKIRECLDSTEMRTLVAWGFLLYQSKKKFVIIDDFSQLDVWGKCNEANVSRQCSYAISV